MLLSSHSVMSDSLQPNGLQYTRLPCPSLSPRVCSNSFSAPLNWWRHPTTVALFSSCPQSFPASEFFFFFPSKLAFHIRWSKYWSFSFSISLPMNIQDCFPLGLTSLISLLSKELSRVFFTMTIWKHQFLTLSLFYGSCASIYGYWKSNTLTLQTSAY